MTEHEELLALHTLLMCPAECQPIQAGDTHTIRALKGLIHNWHELGRELGQKPPAEPAGWVRIVPGHSGPVAADVEWQREKPERAGLWQAIYFKPPNAKVTGSPALSASPCGLTG